VCGTFALLQDFDERKPMETNGAEKKGATLKTRRKEIASEKRKNVTKKPDAI